MRWRKQSLDFPTADRRRVVIEALAPEIDGGRFPIERTVGESVSVAADVFADGHDRVAAVVLHRRQGDLSWSESAMQPLSNDRWHAAFEVSELGSYLYTVEAWIDGFDTWRRDFAKRLAVNQQELSDLRTGAALVDQARTRAQGSDAEALALWADKLRRADAAAMELGAASGDELEWLMARYPDRSRATRYERELAVTVEREKARFSAWYEIFPRSCGPAGAMALSKIAKRGCPMSPRWASTCLSSAHPSHRQHPSQGPKQHHRQRPE